MVQFWTLTLVLGSIAVTIVTAVPLLEERGRLRGKGAQPPTVKLSRSRLGSGSGIGFSLPGMTDEQSAVALAIAANGKRENLEDLQARGRLRGGGVQRPTVGPSRGRGGSGSGTGFSLPGLTEEQSALALLKAANGKREFVDLELEERSWEVLDELD